MECKNLISFPTARVQMWNELERGVRELVSSSGGDPAAADFVCSRLHKSFDSVWGEITVTVDEQNLLEVQALTAFLQEKQNAWLLQLILAYLEIYRLSHE